MGKTKKIKATLTIEIVYESNGATAKEIKEHLLRVSDNLSAEGELTGNLGDYATTVETWEATVKTETVVKSNYGLHKQPDGYLNLPAFPIDIDGYGRVLKARKFMTTQGTWVELTTEFDILKMSFDMFIKEVKNSDPLAL
jgi:hypothetical protein